MFFIAKQGETEKKKTTFDTFHSPGLHELHELHELHASPPSLLLVFPPRNTWWAKNGMSHGDSNSNTWLYGLHLYGILPIWNITYIEYYLHGILPIWNHNNSI